MGGIIAGLIWLIEALLSLAVAILFSVCLALLAFAVFVRLVRFLPLSLSFRIRQRLGIDPWASERPSEEYYVAQRHHRSIGSWVAQCVGADSVDDLPTAVYVGFGLNLRDRAPSNPFREGRNESRKLTNAERNLLLLSQNLTFDREMYWAKSRRKYIALQASTWFTIIVGLITTILVSLSSTDFGKGDTGAAPAIRILAIVFPVVGTATAAVIAFYRPLDEMGRTSHALASFRQLHSQIALEIWSLECGANPGPLDPKLADWIKRYNDIQAVAEVAAPSGSDQGAARPPGGGNRDGKAAEPG